MKLTYIQVLIKKECMARILFKNRGSILSLDILHAQICIQQNILGAMAFL